MFKWGHFTSSSSGTIWIQMHLCMIFAFDLEKTLSWWLLLVILIALVLDECWARESKNKADRNNHCEHTQDKPICRIHLMSLVTCVLESWAINADHCLELCTHLWITGYLQILSSHILKYKKGLHIMMTSTLDTGSWSTTLCDTLQDPSGIQTQGWWTFPRHALSSCF